MSAGLVVFARAPEASKSRLADACGRAAATRVATALFDDTLTRGEQSGLAPRWLHWDGPEAHPLPEAARRRNWRLAGQAGDDLGERMATAFTATLGRCERVVLMGTDCPDLGARVIAGAAARLALSDTVMVPASDGGYVLIGLTRKALPELGTLFTGIDWGGPGVAAETRERVAACGLALMELTPLADLDDGADLERLAERHPFLAAARDGG